ncbi:MAG TPA: ABC transporter permease [Vicinamibacterales bacterium]|jgi:ABC-2 type transport system permease protein|nr:ABC transporter permease [Vicinamibacterales bacterium]
MNGLWRLTWLEIKIFIREPLGLFGTVGVPVLVFLGLGRVMRGAATPASPEEAFLRAGLPVFAALLMAISAVVSLVTVIAIYREGGILKRLRATPLRPATILVAHVLVKLLFTALTLALLIAAGRRVYAPDSPAQVIRFAAALLFTTCSLLSVGFLIASLVPTARFAQPLAGVIFYPMIALSGLFFPLALLPPWLEAVARILPLTHAVSLMQGMWRGDPLSSHLWDAGVIALVFAACTALSARVFRWE